MNYDEAVAWLYATQGVGIKLGLENIQRLLTLLHVPITQAPDSPVILHAAGTNGKGSTCAMLAAITQAAGYKTGLFTSPHLVTYRERIRLNGEMIPEAAVADGLTRIRGMTEAWEHPPTFFEITTALALDWYRQQHAEVVILETGLGGRLDSTNALPATVSLLTPISLDHQQYLGNTLEAIAAEKAGIFKPGIPVISAPQPPEVAAVIAAAAQRVGAPLSWVTAPIVPTALPVALSGTHQHWNAALAIAALQASPLTISEAAIRTGLQQVAWPGRFQRLPLSGLPDGLILDGAHNEAAAERLRLTWREEYGDERPVLLLGVLADKDARAICHLLRDLAAAVILTPLQNPRTTQPEALLPYFAESRIPLHTAASVGEALRLAKEVAHQLPPAPRRILATGSLFLVGELLALTQERPEEPTSLQ